ncbi:MAG TPA: hypothetical protein VGB20_03180 [bacterium]
MNRPFMRAVVGVVLAISPSAYLLAQEDITITSFYPSPRGVYQELRATNDVYLAYDVADPTSVVSIGTDTVPPTSTAKLYVLGSVEADAFRAFEQSGVYGFIEAQPNDGWANMGAFNVATNAFAPLNIDGIPVVLQNRSGGNVGIGKATPAAKLDVLGTVRISGLNAMLEAEPAQSLVLRQTNGGSLHLDTSGLIYVRDADSGFANRVVIDPAAGQMTIGEWLLVPQARLQVHDPAGGASFLRLSNATTGDQPTDGFWVGLNANEEAVLNNAEPTPMRFLTGNAERMQIGAAGTLGVGTAPAASSRALVRGIGTTAGTDSLRTENSTGATTFRVRDDGTTAFHPQCRVVTDSGPPPTYVSIAWCAADEFLMGGGGSCDISSAPYIGVLHTNRPDANLRFWTTDCYNRNPDDDMVSVAYAICCKMQ